MGCWQMAGACGSTAQRGRADTARSALLVASHVPMLPCNTHAPANALQAAMMPAHTCSCSTATRTRTHLWGQQEAERAKHDAAHHEASEEARVAAAALSPDTCVCRGGW